MDPRTAAELLYESEATLRMVDHVLDELQASDADALGSSHPLPAALDSYDESASPESRTPSDFRIRVYWQIHEALEHIRQSREAVRSFCRSDEVDGTELDDHGAHAFAILDQLDRDLSPPDRRALHEDLRHDLLRAFSRPDRHHASSDRLSTITAHLAEAEARLTRLGHLFEGAQDWR